jgi:hypothetical protein
VNSHVRYDARNLQDLAFMSVATLAAPRTQSAVIGRYLSKGLALAQISYRSFHKVSLLAVVEASLIN